ncbi:hypothetical protein C8R44DRAFT_985632 [Mycena epipterygia]|nr:hypothetical protein C8R44DRAFT_985632 [Mycena epipterygia]
MIRRSKIGTWMVDGGLGWIRMEYVRDTDTCPILPCPQVRFRPAHAHRPFARSPPPARTAPHAFPPFPSSRPRCASTFHPWLARTPPPHRLRTELSHPLLGARWRSTHTLPTLLLPAYLRRDHLLHALRAGDEEMYARKHRPQTGLNAVPFPGPTSVPLS